MLESLIYVFGAIFLLQVLFFVFAAIFKTDRLTDLSYGLTFIFGSFAAFFLGRNDLSLVHILLLVIVFIWGVRLSGYLFIRILKIGRDKRFDGIRENFFKFASFWLLQAVSVFVILSPTSYVLLSHTTNSLTYMSIIAIGMALLGIVIEGVADQQKFVFKNNSLNEGKWIDTGLWKYSRHPNYLGEIMMWVGVFLYCLPFLSGWGYLTVASPIMIIVLLLFISGIPTLERKYNERYKDNEDYAQYKRNTGRLLPKVFK